MPNSDETPVQADQGSSEPTLVSRSDNATPPPASSDETVVSKSAAAALPLSSADETVIGKSAAAAPPSPAVSDQSIHNQDTVVSPRLRQLATTPAQPLRPPQGVPPQPTGARAPTSTSSSSRLYMLVGIVAVLVLLAVILVGVILARTGPTLLAGVFATKTPTARPTRAATPTSIFPPTFTPPPIPPTSPPTPVPPTKTPRPAPVAVAKDVVAKVSPPEGFKLKVRKSPSSTGDIMGELDKDVQVTILDGPTDANGITWWKVDNGKGLVGWSAEGVGGVKYLLPMGWAN
jgi:hypothetical protein